MKPSDNEIEMLAAGFAIQHKNGLIRFAHALLDRYAPQASEAVRAPDYTLQHADHMAVSAERLMEAVNNRDALIMQREESDDVDDDTMWTQHENVSEYLRGMREAIYEYRKRRERAALSAQPGAQRTGGSDDR